MSNEQPKKNSRSSTESRPLIGSRTEPTSASGSETPATSRPSKKK